IEYPVCINGKKRILISLDAALSQKDIQELVPNLDTVQNLIAGKQVQRIIVVPGKMVNFVIKE
ncbi:MAG TPA: hypothetical protein PK611_11400, partial [Saprospiraceae bacterium]|nr:hypothetical protein [Saprospiraceae bacterium]